MGLEKWHTQFISRLHLSNNKVIFNDSCYTTVVLISRSNLSGTVGDIHNLAVVRVYISLSMYENCLYKYYVYKPP